MVFWVSNLVLGFDVLSNLNLVITQLLMFTACKYPVVIYLFEVNNANTIVKYVQIQQIKALEQCQWHRSGVFIVNFEQISNIFLVFPLLTWP